jgi:hypothetical protein
MYLPEFTTGYKSTNPEATDDEITGSFHIGDLNDSGSLNFREFENLFSIG